MAYQLIKATKFLHENCMLHSDIKPNNILLNRFYNEIRNPSSYKKPDITLCDLGSVYTEDEFGAYEITTLPYRAPDVVLGFNIGYPCDVWSIGCTIFELVTGKRLFEVDSMVELFILIHTTICPFSNSQIEQISSPDNEHQVSLPEEENKLDHLTKNIEDTKILLEKIKQDQKELYDVIMRMLIIDPEKRIRLNEALDLPFFTSIKNKK